MPPVVLVDSPGIGDMGDIEAITARATVCDAILWVVAADRPDREPDRRALAGVRDWFRSQPDRRAPPILVVASHVDRLRPFQEWSPPYDLIAAESPKARSIRDALEAAAGDLGVSSGDMVPTCLSEERGIYNADLVWARLAEMLPAAKAAQLVRRIAEARSGLSWRRLATQARGAGRLAADVLLKGGPTR
jgi:hypothetical protein